MVKSGQLTNIVDSVSTTNQQNLSTIKNVDLRKSHPHQQNWSIVQIVDSLLDPNQQMVSLKIGETTKCTLGFFLHNNKFVDQQSGSNVQIVVSGPTSTNCVIPNLPRGSRQLYLLEQLYCYRSFIYNDNILKSEILFVKRRSHQSESLTQRVAGEARRSNLGLKRSR